MGRLKRTKQMRIKMKTYNNQQKLEISIIMLNKFRNKYGRYRGLS